MVRGRTEGAAALYLAATRGRLQQRLVQMHGDELRNLVLGRTDPVIAQIEGVVYF